MAAATNTGPAITPQVSRPRVVAVSLLVRVSRMVMINLLLVRSCLHLGVEQRKRFSTSRAQETFEKKSRPALSTPGTAKRRKDEGRERKPARSR
jgi:hypothetical protein